MTVKEIFKTELEPGKKYIIAVDRDSMPMSDVHALADALHKEKIDGVVVAVRGKTKDAFQVIEAPGDVE